MLPAEALSRWSACCASAGICWYLYGESLLCAVGCGTFPESLEKAQVLVFARDLHRLLPLLPEDWQPDRNLFTVKKAPLSLRKDGEVILEIFMLHGVDSPGQAGEDSLTADRLRARARGRQFLQKLLGRLSGGLLEGTLQKRQQHNDRKFASALLALAEEGGSAAYYTDVLSCGEATLLPAEWFAGEEQLACEGLSWPVFAGFRDYLRAVYGDYEAGLGDEIGCGLTAQEKEELKRHQAHCLQALGFVQQLSEEFGLRYYLLAGSVLGCVRHGGFIPWDDDMDLGIRIEDLARFEEVVKQELPKRLPEEFQLLQPGPDNGYPRMFSKICYEGRCCMDLWPLVPTYTEGWRANVLWYFAKLITKVHYRKLGRISPQFERLAWLMGLFTTDRMVLRLARWNERKYRSRNTPAYINLYSIYRRDKETILRRWLDTEATGEFAGISVPLVGCTGEYLRHLYGDYNRIPPPWKRSSRHVDRFSVGDGEK